MKFSKSPALLFVSFALVASFYSATSVSAKEKPAEKIAVLSAQKEKAYQTTCMVEQKIAKPNKFVTLGSCILGRVELVSENSPRDKITAFIPYCEVKTDDGQLNVEFAYDVKANSIAFVSNFQNERKAKKGSSFSVIAPTENEVGENYDNFYGVKGANGSQGIRTRCLFADVNKSLPAAVIVKPE